MKKNNDGLFDATMGSYGGAEVCELVELYILDQLGGQYNKENTGLYDQNQQTWLKIKTASIFD